MFSASALMHTLPQLVSGGSGGDVEYESIGEGDSHSSGTTLTWNHTVGSVNNGYIIVYVMSYGSSGDVSSVTYDGSPMTVISDKPTWSDGGSYYMRAYGLADPASGTNEIVVTLTSSESTANSVLYSGVDSENVSVSSTSQNSGAWSDAVTVPANGMTSHAFGSRVTTPGDLAGGPILYNHGTARNWLAVQDTDIDTTFTGSSTGRGWGAITVELPAAPTVVEYASIGGGDSHSSGTTLTWNHTVADVNNGYLVVHVIGYNPSYDVSSVTYDGSPMTVISDKPTWSDGGSYFMRAYGLADPASGTKQVVVTLSSSTYATANSVLYSGVGDINVSSTSQNSGAWSDAVIVPTNGMVSHSFGSLIESVNPDPAINLYNYGTGWTWLTLQDTDMDVTFTADSNGRGWGAITIELEP